MTTLQNIQIVDTTLVITVNLIMIVMTGLFICRAFACERVEPILGLIIVLTAIPLGLVSVFNLIEKREWWFFILLLPFLIFCMIEFFFDYIFKLDFRNSILIYPYLFIYYSGLIALIGYTFIVGRIYGFITLVLYFVQLFAAWFAHSRTSTKV